MDESRFRRKTLTVLGIGLGLALVLALLGGESVAGSEAPASSQGPSAGLAAPVDVPPLRHWRLEHANWEILAEEAVAEATPDESSEGPGQWKGLDIGVVGE